MEVFVLEIELGNAAFSDEEGGRSAAVAGILRDYARRLDRGDPPRLLRDTNGNAVGRARTVDRRRGRGDSDRTIREGV